MRIICVLSVSVILQILPTESRHLQHFFQKIKKMTCSFTILPTFGAQHFKMLEMLPPQNRLNAAVTFGRFFIFSHDAQENFTQLVRSRPHSSLKLN